MGKKILIGKITGAFGIHGEVKVYNYSGFEDRYENLDRIIASDTEIPIEGVRHHKGMILLRLEGVSSRDDAEKLRGTKVYMTEDDLLELPEDEFYIRDLIGIDVVDAERGLIGQLKDVLTDRPQDLYIVKLTEGGECMIPAVSAFVKGIDMEARRMDVSLIEGMI